MADSAETPATLDEFFRRWEASGAAERANYSMFMNELWGLLEVPRPDPAGPDDEKNAYVFERAVPFPNPDGKTTVKRIDLYKRDCFVLEAKQGSNKVAEPEAFTLSAPKKMKRGTAVRGTAGWDAAMYEAKGQAELYVRNLPSSEHNPPFIAVVDVGHTIELFADFSRQGRTYIPFPDPGTHRIELRGLADEKIRERLRLVWTEPLALDPSRRTAKVTREVAAKLAELARSLEQSGYTPDLAAHFLMRRLFAFFVGGGPPRSTPPINASRNSPVRVPRRSKARPAPAWLLVTGDNAKNPIKNTDRLRSRVLWIADQIRATRFNLHKPIPVSLPPATPRGCSIREASGQRRGQVSTWNSHLRSTANARQRFALIPKLFLVAAFEVDVGMLFEIGERTRHGWKALRIAFRNGHCQNPGRSELLHFGVMDVRAFRRDLIAVVYG